MNVSQHHHFFFLSFSFPHSSFTLNAIHICFLAHQSNFVNYKICHRSHSITSNFDLSLLWYCSVKQQLFAIQSLYRSNYPDSTFISFHLWMTNAMYTSLYTTSCERMYLYRWQLYFCEERKYTHASCIKIGHRIVCANLLHNIAVIRYYQLHSTPFITRSLWHCVNVYMVC